LSWLSSDIIETDAAPNLRSLIKAHDYTSKLDPHYLSGMRHQLPEASSTRRRTSVPIITSWLIAIESLKRVFRDYRTPQSCPACFYATDMRTKSFGPGHATKCRKPRGKSRAPGASNVSPDRPGFGYRKRLVIAKIPEESARYSTALSSRRSKAAHDMKFCKRSIAVDNIVKVKTA
jgi:hypothetical protein